MPARGQKASEFPAAEESSVNTRLRALADLRVRHAARRPGGDVWLGKVQGTVAQKP